MEILANIVVSKLIVGSMVKQCQLCFCEETNYFIIYMYIQYIATILLGKRCIRISYVS